MFDYIKGRLVAKMPTYLVIEQNGIGYRLEIPLSTYEKLKDKDEAQVYTYLRHSEDDIRLYGFATHNERLIFNQFIENVSQLGPSKALAILSSISLENLVNAIEQQDLDTLRMAKGIGDKLARRILTEMKGKLPQELLNNKSSFTPGETLREAISALISLGYNRKEAQEAVEKAERILGAGAGLEDVIKKSLEFV